MAKDRRIKQAALGAAPTGKKNPVSSIIPMGKKSAKIAAEPPKYYDRKPAWRISRIQLADPYGWQVLNLDQVRQIRDKLAQFETMTWGEIFEKDRDRNHPIEVVTVKCREARRWMETNMPDYPTLWTLRLSGPERIWGIFSEGVYQIIFWDPRHLIFPTRK